MSKRSTKTRRRLKRAKKQRNRQRAAARLQERRDASAPTRSRRIFNLRTRNLAVMFSFEKAVYVELDELSLDDPKIDEALSRARAWEAAGHPTYGDA